MRAVSGSGSSFQDRAFEVAVVARPVWQTPATLPPAQAGAPYSAVLTATGATSYSSGSGVPPGLTLSAAGLLSGAPSAAGSYSFVVVAASSGLTASRQFDVVVAP